MERLGESWISSHPLVPWRLIKAMRNRIAHNYWTVDDDIVWEVVDRHAMDLHRHLVKEIEAARKVLLAADE